MKAAGFRYALLAVSGLSFLALMLSASAYLLNWRVVNEPGAILVHWLPEAFRVLFSAGLAGILLSNGYLIICGTRPLALFLAPPGAALLLYLPVLVLTLVMLV